MSQLVKITFDDRGEETYAVTWCLSVVMAGSPTALCSQQVYGFGESAAKYETKQGKVNCPECICLIKEIKKVEILY